jgi:hypothetical protein
MNDACPLCGSKKNSIVEQYETIGPAKYECWMVRCTDCGHYFTKTEQDLDLEQLYSEGQYEVLDTRGSLFEKIVAFDDRFIVRQLSEFPVPEKTLLDFGCGKGQFMCRALEYGWQAYGVETGKKRAEFGKTLYGLNISTSEYKGGLIKGGPVGAVTLFHVLEHLDRPKTLVRELIDGNLVPDGYLVIEVPLFESLQSKIAGKWWLHLDPPLHVSHFTKEALLKFVNDLGLEPVKIGSLSIRLGVLGMVQSLMSVFGYRKMIISELKFNRSKRLMLSIILALPLAVILELSAALFNKGGVIRIYCKAAGTQCAGRT